MKYIISLLIFFLFTLPFNAQEKAEIPELKTYVTDYTNTLNELELQQMESLLTKLKAENGAQVVLVIVPTTGVETIEEYALKIAEKNKVGRKKKDDGVVVLIAKNDRKIRIEVGYGLEGILTDADCKRIISEIITPKFKEKNFYEGVKLGVDAIILKINGKSIFPDKAGTNNKAKDSDELNQYLPVIILLVIGYFVHFIFGLIISAFFAGFGALFVGPIFMGFNFIETLALAVILFFVSFVFNLLGNLSLGSGSSSSSSGGFSGGGGSFGGGGSSGSW
jgi:uncharacterized protein